ncbi:hypothetical protein MMC13_007416 [Lambiella insularis]|nr:hypothetical protein [Lambiella insularis]
MWKTRGATSQWLAVWFLLQSRNQFAAAQAMSANIMAPAPSGGGSVTEVLSLATTVVLPIPEVTKTVTQQITNLQTVTMAVTQVVTDLRTVTIPGTCSLTTPLLAVNKTSTAMAGTAVVTTKLMTTTAMTTINPTSLATPVNVVTPSTFVPFLTQGFGTLLPNGVCDMCKCNCPAAAFGVQAMMATTTMMAMPTMTTMVTKPANSTVTQTSALVQTLKISASNSTTTMAKSTTPMSTSAKPVTTSMSTTTTKPTTTSPGSTMIVHLTTAETVTLALGSGSAARSFSLVSGVSAMTVPLKRDAEPTLGLG